MDSTMTTKSFVPLIEHYKEFLPVTDKTPIVSINEGFTPLIKADRIAEKTGIKGLKLYLKYDGANPTGSFKDRGMTMAISKALEEGSKSVMCASTGNTSASAAAYSAKAGLKCYVLIPDGYIALGKLSQAMLYGADIIAIDGNFDEALEIVLELTKSSPITLVNSLNPYRIDGQQTSAFEICDKLNRAPDYLCIPVGNAGNITAYWKGFKAYYNAGKISQKPVMYGFEAEGAAAIVKGERILKPETIATAIRIGNPASWEHAVNAANESNGKVDFVTDNEILNAYRDLARLEGVFCEPASAASVAGLYKAACHGKLKENSLVVCVLTGNGLKDPDCAINNSNCVVKKTSSNLEDIKQMLAL
ncbi:MAG: threonine synthase [Cyanobacteriota bacterium]